MEGSAGLSKGLKDERCWRGFKQGPWCTTIDVRGFIVSNATPYAGDAYFADWPKTLDALAALQPEKLVPGRGPALTDRRQIAEGLAGTRAFVSELYAAVAAAARNGKDLRAIYADTYATLRPKYGHWVIFDHCLPFDVTRAYDEATAHPDPRCRTGRGQMHRGRSRVRHRRSARRGAGR